MGDNKTTGIIRILTDLDIPDFLKDRVLVVNNKIYLLQEPGKNCFPTGTPLQYEKVGDKYEFHEI